ncbi:MAG: hypothetical protein ABW133_02945, partial [Polyangiaceae bacterium]
QFVLEITRRTEALAARMKEAAGQAQHVVLLTSGDVSVWLYAWPLARDAHMREVPESCWWVASAAKGKHLVARTGPASFSIEASDHGFSHELFEGLFRAQRVPFAIESEVAQCGATLRVGDLRDGAPYRLNVRVDRSLDDPTIAMLAWRDGKIERVMPSEQKNGLTVPWSPGLTGGF